MAGLQFTTNTIIGLVMLAVTLIVMVVFLCLKKNIDDGEEASEQENNATEAVSADEAAQESQTSEETEDAPIEEPVKEEAAVEEPVQEEAAVEEQPVEEPSEAKEEEEPQAEAAESESGDVAQPQPEKAADDSVAAVTEGRPALNIPIGKRRTFTEKILEADDENKAIYNMLKNELMSYKKVTNRLTKTIDIFKYKSTYLAKISIAGKTVKLHLALDPKDYAETKYHQKDLGEKKKYEFVPLALKVKSDRSKKYAIELITEVMSKAELVKNDKYQPADYVAIMQAAQED